jgi:hypothetical protein
MALNSRILEVVTLFCVVRKLRPKLICPIVIKVAEENEARKIRFAGSNPGEATRQTGENNIYYVGRHPDFEPLSGQKFCKKFYCTNFINFVNGVSRLF